MWYVRILWNRYLFEYSMLQAYKFCCVSPIVNFKTCSYTTYNRLFVKFIVSFEIKNGKYIETMLLPAGRFRCGSFQMAIPLNSSIFDRESWRVVNKRNPRFFRFIVEQNHQYFVPPSLVGLRSPWNVRGIVIYIVLMHGSSRKSTAAVAGKSFLWVKSLRRTKVSCQPTIVIIVQSFLIPELQPRQTKNYVKLSTWIFHRSFAATSASYFRFLSYFRFSTALSPSLYGPHV